MDDSINSQPDTPDSVDLPVTPDTAPSGDANTTADDVPQQTEQEHKPSRGVQKRIDELTAQRHRAEREADFYRQLLEQRQQLQPQPQPQHPEPQSQTPDAPPKFDDFESIEDYVTAAAEYKAKELLRAEKAAAEQAERQRHQQQTQAQRMQTVQQKISEAEQKYPGLYDRISDPALPVTESVVDALMDAENFADLANHLAANPSELARLAALPPHRLGYEVARIEARLSAQPVVKASSAPPPVSPVRPSASPSAAPDPATDPEGWIRYRNEQARAR
jgi:hypothetical protein